MIKDNSVATQNSKSAMEGKTTLSRQIQHKVEVKFVMTKKSIVATKVEKNCKTNVATQKVCLDTIKNLRQKALCDNDQAIAIEFCLNNQIYVATIKVVE